MAAGTDGREGRGAAASGPRRRAADAARSRPASRSAGRPAPHADRRGAAQVAGPDHHPARHRRRRRRVPVPRPTLCSAGRALDRSSRSGTAPRGRQHGGRGAGPDAELGRAGHLRRGAGGCGPLPPPLRQPRVARGPVGRPVGCAWVPAAAALPEGRRIKFEVSTPYDATEALMKRIRIRQDPGGSFLRIELKGTDPALTAQTVNAVAERTVTLAADLKQRKFAELTRILGEQYQQAQQSVSAAEKALAAFRVRTAGVVQQGAPVVSPSLAIKGDPLFARAYELRFNVEQLERERRVIDRVLGDVPKSGLKVEALAVLPSVQQSPELNNALAEVTQKEAELRALRSRYTDQSAPVLQAKADLDSLERSAVPALAQKLAANLAAREAAFKPEMDSAYGYMRRVPPIALEEDRLKRELAGAEALFGTVSQRYEAARLALIRSSSDV